jgi:hypothetical protein
MNQREHEGRHAEQHRDGQREAPKQKTQHSLKEFVIRDS